MIKLTRIQGEHVYINENNIQWIECNPDTTITFINGQRFIVKETLEEVLHLFNKNNFQANNEENQNTENFLSHLAPDDEHLIS